MNPFFKRLKIQAFKKMLRISNSQKLLLSLPSREPDISGVTDCVLHLIYNRPFKEKTP